MSLQTEKVRGWFSSEGRQVESRDTGSIRRRRRTSSVEYRTRNFLRRCGSPVGSPGNAPYQFTASIPPGLKDGLDVGSLEDAGLNVALIGKMVEQIANETHKNVDSVLLIKKGKLVLEEYFYQYDRDKLHQLRSATKSVVSALVGIALDKKLIASKEESVVPFFPEYEIKNLSAEKWAITVEHLLACESGLGVKTANGASPGEEQKMKCKSRLGSVYFRPPDG